MADTIFPDEEPAPRRKVGYKSPPEEHQFKPGGRPGPGRPKGSKSLKNLIRKYALRKVTIKLDGKSVTLPSGEALLLRMLRDGIAGNARATAQAIKLMEVYGLEDEPTDAATADLEVLTEDELAVYTRLNHKVMGVEHEWLDMLAEWRKEDNDRAAIWGRVTRTELDDQQEYDRQFSAVFEETKRLASEAIEEDELTRANRIRAEQGLSPLRPDDLDDPPPFDDDDDDDDDEED